jgi:pilus assembly protein CpaF
MKTFPWLQELLADPQVTDICINGTQSIFVDRGQGLEPFELLSQPPAPRIPLQEESLRKWVLNELSQAGKTWDAKYPFVDATLASGYRIHVTFPPLSPHGLLISLRRLAALNNKQLKQENSPPKGHRWTDSSLYHSLAQAVRRGDSVLISGATGSGKTTLASDLLEEIPSTERIIALEDTPELCPAHPHFLSLLSRPPNSDGYGEVTLRSLLRQTLRMRPDRIVLGECRGAEVLELLQTLNTGHRGALATLHANSPRDALRRVELLCLLSNGGITSSSIIRELLSLGVQWITQVRQEGKRRKIVELWKIEGREGDTILMRPVLE